MCPFFLDRIGVARGCSRSWQYLYCEHRLRDQIASLEREARGNLADVLNPSEYLRDIIINTATEVVKDELQRAAAPETSTSITCVLNPSATNTSSIGTKRIIELISTGANVRSVEWVKLLTDAVSVATHGASGACKIAAVRSPTIDAMTRPSAPAPASVPLVVV